MKSQHVFKSVRSAVKHWYAPLISGIILIGAGILAFIFGKATFLTLTLVFSISFLLSGIAETVFSIVNRKSIDSWGWSLAFGLINLIFGVLLLANFYVTMLVFPFFIGFAFLFRSIGGIGQSLNLKKQGISNWSWLLAFAILGMLFSIMLVLNPLFAGITIVVLTGVVLIIGGIFSISLSVLLKKMNKFSHKVKEHVQEIKERVQEHFENRND